MALRECEAVPSSALPVEQKPGSISLSSLDTLKPSCSPVPLNVPDAASYLNPLSRDERTGLSFPQLDIRPEWLKKLSSALGMDNSDAAPSSSSPLFHLPNPAADLQFLAETSSSLFGLFKGKKPSATDALNVGLFAVLAVTLKGGGNPQRITPSSIDDLAKGMHQLARRGGIEVGWAKIYSFIGEVMTGIEAYAGKSGTSVDSARSAKQILEGVRIATSSSKSTLLALLDTKLSDSLAYLLRWSKAVSPSVEGPERLLQIFRNPATLFNSLEKLPPRCITAMAKFAGEPSQPKRLREAVQAVSKKLPKTQPAIPDYPAAAQATSNDGASVFFQRLTELGTTNSGAAKIVSQIYEGVQGFCNSAVRGAEQLSPKVWEQLSGVFKSISHTEPLVFAKLDQGFSAQLNQLLSLAHMASGGKVEFQELFLSVMRRPILLRLKVEGLQRHGARLLQEVAATPPASRDKAFKQLREYLDSLEAAFSKR